MMIFYILQKCPRAALKVKTPRARRVLYFEYVQNITLVFESSITIVEFIVISKDRHYKPSSLLTKYKEHNQRIVNELEEKNKENIALNNIVAKYQTLYPEAKIEISSDYYRSRRNYNSFPIVEVKFPSGSWVQFQLGYSNNLEEVRFYKKYDAQSETTKDLLDRFNNQKA